MKNCKPLYVVIGLFISINQNVMASDSAYMSDDIETPDALLRSTETENKHSGYGEGNIVISSQGAKNNSIVKPDLLESSLSEEGKDKTASKDMQLKSGDATDKAIEHPDALLRSTKKQSVGKKNNPSHRKRDDLEMPDPLLDNVN